MRLRFFIFVLFAATLPMLVALMVTAKTVHITHTGFDDRLSAAQNMLNSRFEADAAQRRELLLRLSDPAIEIGGKLQGLAKAKEGAKPALATEFRRVLADLSAGRQVPEFAAVATPYGAAIAVTERDVVLLPIEETPLAKGAFDGHHSDTWALYDGDLYRFFAIPVGIAEGALIIGDRVADATASRMREATQTDVSFLIGDFSQASSLLDEDRDSVLAAAQRPSSVVRSGRISMGIPGLELFDNVFPLMAPGEARVSLARKLENQVSVVVSMDTGKELSWLGAMQLFSLALALGLLVAGLVWNLLIFGPVVRQARSIERHLARLRVERGAQLTAKGFSAPFTSLVHTLDKLAEHLAKEKTSLQSSFDAARAHIVPEHQEETPSVFTTTARNLLRAPEELPLQSAPVLGDGDEAEGTPAAFPFGDDPALSQIFTKPPAPRAGTPSPQSNPPTPAAASPGKGSGAAETSASASPSRPEAAQGSDAQTASDRPLPPLAKGNHDQVVSGSALISAPETESAPSPPTLTPSDFPDSDSIDEDNLEADLQSTLAALERVVDPEVREKAQNLSSGSLSYEDEGFAAAIAQKPARVAVGGEPAAKSPVQAPSSSASTPAPSATPAPSVPATAAAPAQQAPRRPASSAVPLPAPEGSGPRAAASASDSSDPAHFAQIYQEFLATRQACGESTQGLDEASFVARLENNRTQIVEKYNCKAVRFQVYVKEGKAAIKASPVR